MRKSQEELTLSYAIPSELAALVNRQANLREYQAQDEVFQASIAFLDESQNEKVVVDPVVVAGVRKGLAEIEAGLGIPFDKFDAEIRANLGVSDDT